MSKIGSLLTAFVGCVLIPASCCQFVPGSVLTLFRRPIHANWFVISYFFLSRIVADVPGLVLLAVAQRTAREEVIDRFLARVQTSRPIDHQTLLCPHGGGSPPSPHSHHHPLEQLVAPLVAKSARRTHLAPQPLAESKKNHVTI